MSVLNRHLSEGRSLRRSIPAVMLVAAMLVMAGALQALTIDWTRTYNSSGNGGDEAYGIAVGPDDRIYVVGQVEIPVQNNDGWVRRYRANGNKVWTRTVKGPVDDLDNAQDVAVGPQGRVHVVGFMRDGSGDFSTFLRRYSASGKKLWTKTYFEGQGHGVAVGDDGRIYVVGSAKIAGKNDIWVRCYRPSGTKVWTRIYNGPADGSDLASAVAVDSKGRVYVVGSVVVPGKSGDPDHYDLWLRKYSPSGKTLWTRKHNGTANDDDRANDVAVDGQDRIYVVGSTSISGEGQNVWVRKYDSSGTKLWTRTFNGKGERPESGQAVAVAPSGRVYVAGWMYRKQASNDIWIRRYSASGAVVWTRNVKGPTNGSDSAWGIATDSANGVYVVGTVDDATQDQNMWIRKYLD